MKDGERERPIENYGKKEQKEWLDNILPDPHPCAIRVVRNAYLILQTDTSTMYHEHLMQNKKKTQPTAIKPGERERP